MTRNSFSSFLSADSIAFFGEIAVQPLRLFGLFLRIGVWRLAISTGRPEIRFGCSHAIDSDKIRVYSEIGVEFSQPTEQPITVSEH